MQIYSNNIKDGKLDSNMGHFSNEILKNAKPTRSFHLGWKDLPEGTKSLALIFIDHDAIPVCGFSWIHWTVANIDPKFNELPENASIEQDLLEGVTSWSSKLLPEDYRLTKEEDVGFGGCAPPDKTHEYTIMLYALDSKLNLSRGFMMNELLHAMKGHILEKSKLTATYDSK